MDDYCNQGKDALGARYVRYDVQTNLRSRFTHISAWTDS